MRSLKIVTFAVTGLCSLFCPRGSTCYGQFGEKFHKPVSVMVRHAPQIALKGVTRIIVMDFGGSCGPELTDRLRQTLADSKKFELMDRADLDSILKEHNLQLSGEVNSLTVAKMGQFLGASALITGRVNRCNVETSEPLKAGYPYRDRNGNVHQDYVHRTKAFINAQIQLVDLTTSKIYQSMSFDTPEAVRENKMTDVVPEAPDKDTMQTMAYDLLVRKVSRVILPWSDVQDIYFFHDDKANVSKSVELVRTGDFENAVKLLREGIETYQKGEKVNNETLSKAYYNLGMCLVVMGVRDEGRRNLLKSNELHHSDFATTGIQLCDRMIQEDNRFRAQEAAALELGASSSRQSGDSSEEVITNDDVIAMSQAKMSDSLIVTKIKTSKTKFDVTTKALLALKKSGVSDAVIEAMTQRPH